MGFTSSATQRRILYSNSSSSSSSSSNSLVDECCKNTLEFSLSAVAGRVKLHNSHVSVNLLAYLILSKLSINLLKAVLFSWPICAHNSEFTIIILLDRSTQSSALYAYFCPVISFFIFLSSSNILESHRNDLSHMLESKSSLQTGVQNLGSSSPKIEGRKTTYFGRSSATLQLKVDLTADIF